MDLDRLTRVEREALRAAATRALAECCDECRGLRRAQLQIGRCSGLPRG